MSDSEPEQTFRNEDEREFNDMLKNSNQNNEITSFETVSLLMDNAHKISKKEKVKQNNKVMEDLNNPDCELPRNDNRKNQIISEITFYLLKKENINLVFTIKFSDINGFAYKSDKLEPFYYMTYIINDKPDIRKSLKDIYNMESFKPYFRNGKSFSEVCKDISAIYDRDYLTIMK